MDWPEGLPCEKPGWLEFHIPGSYPLNVSGHLNGTAYPDQVEAIRTSMLTPFATSAYKDSRILVQCWKGRKGNWMSEVLSMLGFTNIHTIGPTENGGILLWKAAGYPIVSESSYYPRVPQCKACQTVSRRNFGSRHTRRRNSYP